MDRAERLVNVVIALYEARKPMTLDDIRQRTRYYTQADSESGRRQFERDKDALKDMGVPIVMKPTDLLGPADGYIIEADDYTLPDVTFEPDELAALAIALRATGEERAQLALARLGPEAGHAPQELSWSVTVPRPNIDPIAQALADRRQLRFTYRSSSGEAKRTVEPWSLIMRGGAVYLVAKDVDKDERRTFRIDRIVGAVKSVGDAHAYEIPDDVAEQSSFTPATAAVTVELVADPQIAWSLTARGATEVSRDERGVEMRMEGLDPTAAATMLIGYGAQVDITAPESVATEVERRRTAVREAHLKLADR